MKSRGRLKITPIRSANFEVVIIHSVGEERSVWYAGWYIRNLVSLAHTSDFTDFEDEYRRLKRVWRKSKEDFDSACRFMDFHNLFSHAGVKYNDEN